MHANHSLAQIFCGEKESTNGTYHVDELNHSHAELDSHRIREVFHWSYERVVTILKEQFVHQANLVVTAQTCQSQQWLTCQSRLKL